MIDLTDGFIAKLKNDDNNKEIYYSDSKPVTLNGLSGRVAIIVRPSSKTFVFRFKSLKYQLGKFEEGIFGISEARYKATQIINGDIDEADLTEAPSFEKMWNQVMEYKEKVLFRRGTAQDISRLKQIPNFIKKLPITMLSFRDTYKLRDYMLKHHSAGAYNHMVSSCSAVWTRGKREFYRDLLDGKDNPFSDMRIETVVKKIRKKPKFSDIIEMWKLLNDFMPDNFWKTFYKLKALFGCHNPELYRLKLENIIEDEYGHWLFMPVGVHKNSDYKNQITHRLWLHPKTYEMIQKHIAEFEPKTYLFESPIIPDHHVQKNSCTTRFQRFKKASGYEFASDLCRHALITWFYKKGNAEVITGHCYKGSTAREHYMNFDDPEVVKDFVDNAKMYQEAFIEELGDEFIGDVKSE